MRIHEVVTRDQLKEFLTARGYTYVGEGSYAAVFTSPHGHLFKVYGTRYPGIEFSSRLTFDPLEFYRVARRINNPYVPRFGTPRRFTVAGQEYIGLPTERLDDLPEQRGLKRALNFIADYNESESPSSNYVKSGEKISIIDKMKIHLKSLGKKAPLRTKLEQVIALAEPFGSMWDDFFETEQLVCSQHSCDDFDYTGGNLLWRGNVPVINDPYAYTGFKSNINESIGPHRGVEFELMLAGEKPLAWLDDEEFSSKRRKIAELVEKSGWIVHQYLRHGSMRYILALPGHENDVKEFLELTSSPEYNSYKPLSLEWQKAHRRVGQLLGYSKEDIDEYIENVRQRNIGKINEFKVVDGGGNGYLIQVCSRRNTSRLSGKQYIVQDLTAWAISKGVDPEAARRALVTGETVKGTKNTYRVGRYRL
jgi:hypothetical protein